MPGDKGCREEQGAGEERTTNEQNAGVNWVGEEASDGSRRYREDDGSRK